MFVVGSGVDVTAIKAHLTQVLSLPVVASEEPQIALARGAALASANTPRFDTSTIGLAYSQEVGGTVSASPGTATWSTAPPHRSAPRRGSGRPQAVPVGGQHIGRHLRVGITALAITMAVRVQPAIDQGMTGQTAVHPNELVLPPATATANRGPAADARAAVHPHHGGPAHHSACAAAPTGVRG